LVVSLGKVPAKPRSCSMKHYPKGLDGRQRDRDGEIHKKRGDALVRTIREEHPGFAPGYRSDTKLRTIEKDLGVESLRQALKARKKR
jgi:hypothetical protein